MLSSSSNLPAVNLSNPVVAAVGAVAATSAVMVIGSIVYDKLTGDAYSERDQKRLAELKRLYEESLRKSPPPNWDLDDKARPTHRVKNQNWSLYVQRLRQAQHRVGHYHYQSSLIIEYATTYLTERAKRWFGRGGAGDLIEQFMGDCIDFAMNELPTFGFDDASITKIEQRIAYIERVQKHESIFQFGTVTRGKNNLDTIESIKQGLQTCIEVATHESLRQCAREKFASCRLDISALLLACAKVMYYTRSTDVYYEPLELVRFVEPDDSFLTASAKKLYPKVRSTVTGAILGEVATLAGMKSFGASSGASQGRHESELSFYTEEGEFKPVSWSAFESKESDLPPWVASETAGKHLSEFQELGESILRVANIKQLIEDAYDLTGKVGDIWAYGDRQGKQSLKALIFLLQREVNLLKSRFETLYKYHNTERQTYNLKYRIGAGTGLNLNFNQVDDQKKSFDLLFTSIKTASRLILDQMKKFPENASKRVDAKKKVFYQSISKYLKQFYPDEYSKYCPLEVDERGIKENNDAGADRGDKELFSEDKRQTKVVLTWPLKSHTQDKTHVYLEKPKFTEFSCVEEKSEQLGKMPKKWRLGDKYEFWVKCYFIFNHHNYTTLQTLAAALQEQIENPVAPEEIDHKATALREHLSRLRVKIENERPAWRFKWGVWPIRTKGWPFNRAANKFSDLLLQELELTARKIDVALKRVREEVRQKKDKGNYHGNASKVQLIPGQNFPMVREEFKEQPELNETRAVVDRHLETIKAAYKKIEETSGRFIVFLRVDDLHKMLREIMHYRDSLSKELVSSFLTAWDSMGFLLNSVVDYPDGEIDVVSSEQMRLVVRMIQVVKTESNTTDRAEMEVKFKTEAQQSFSKIELHLAVQSYPNNGLMSQSPHREFKQATPALPVSSLSVCN